MPQLKKKLHFDECFFQQDGAPPHYTLRVRDCLSQAFPQRRLGRRDSTEWPDTNGFPFGVLKRARSLRRILKQDGAPPHYTLRVRDCLSQAFPQRRLGRRDSTEWPDTNGFPFGVLKRARSLRRILKQDGAPPHYTLRVRDCLSQAFPQRRLGRRDSTEWPDTNGFHFGVLKRARFLRRIPKQDGAPPHYTLRVRDCLSQAFPQRRLGRRDSTEWPDTNGFPFGVLKRARSLRRILKQDGAPPHYTLRVRDCLSQAFPQRRLGRRDSTEWPDTNGFPFGVLKRARSLRRILKQDGTPPHYTLRVRDCLSQAFPQRRLGRRDSTEWPDTNGFPFGVLKRARSLRRILKQDGTPPHYTLRVRDCLSQAFPQRRLGRRDSTEWPDTNGFPFGVLKRARSLRRILKQDGAPPHYTLRVRDCLSQAFPQRRLGRRDSTEWPDTNGFPFGVLKRARSLRRILKQDGAPPHYTLRVRDCLSQAFPQRRLGRRDSTEWPDTNGFPFGVLKRARSLRRILKQDGAPPHYTLRVRDCLSQAFPQHRLGRRDSTEWPDTNGFPFGVLKRARSLRRILKQ